MDLGVSISMYNKMDFSKEVYYNISNNGNKFSDYPEFSFRLIPEFHSPLGLFQILFFNCRVL